MPHVVLLGDSIFDNAAYVPDGTAVIEQLHSALSSDWSATLLAIDGDVTGDVNVQLNGLPADASHLVVSCGGNDALGYLSVLDQKVDDVSQALALFATIRDDFRAQYREMLMKVVAHRLPIRVCTVYDRVPGLEPRQQAALAMFNEVIFREALEAGVELIDLRLICSEIADYSELSPIEPSERGGAKIVSAITGILSDEPASGMCVRVYV